ncbi:MAG TPA: DNA repair protein RecN [bacterium]|jgi:DNA repair protein RecN (Recombination protein N)
MLKELIISDFKLLADVNLNFSNGMTALTGETGAGKTQCLQALMLAIGERAGEDVIASGADKCTVTAVFDISERQDIGRILIQDGIIDEEEKELILERTVKKGSQSTGRLNGRRVPIGVLSDVGERLIDILGQNARADILRRSPVEILDSFGDEKHTSNVETTGELFRIWKRSVEEFAGERSEIEKARERRDLVEFQHSELDKAELSAGEEEELTKEHKLLSLAKERIEFAEKGSEILAGESEDGASARDLLVEAVNFLEKLEESDESVNDHLSKLKEALFSVEEISDYLRKYAMDVVDDPEKREEVESRISIIHQLKRKYKTNEAGLITLRDELGLELERVTHSESRLAELQKNVDAAKINYVDEAEKLSGLRDKLGKKISRELKSHLKDLDLKDAEFIVNIEMVKDDDFFHESGMDKVELLISTNKAQDPGPLRKIASGGELSRLLIALKIVLSKRDKVPSLVFDEAEAGIGGETAFRVGEKLSELSKSHQLILVSHLPQVAAQADEQWVVMKSGNGKGTWAEAKRVTGDERVLEITRMLGSRGDKEALDVLARSFLDKEQRMESRQ